MNRARILIDVEAPRSDGEHVAHYGYAFRLADDGTDELRRPERAVSTRNTEPTLADFDWTRLEVCPLDHDPHHSHGEHTSGHDRIDPDAELVRHAAAILLAAYEGDTERAHRLADQLAEHRDDAPATTRGHVPRAAWPLGRQLRENDARNAEPNPYTQRNRDVIGAAERTPAGNTTLRIGRAMLGDRDAWKQIAHVTLTPDERDALTTTLMQHAD